MNEPIKGLKWSREVSERLERLEEAVSLFNIVIKPKPNCTGNTQEKESTGNPGEGQVESKHKFHWNDSFGKEYCSVCGWAKDWLDQQHKVCKPSGGNSETESTPDTYHQFKQKVKQAICKHSDIMECGDCMKIERLAEEHFAKAIEQARKEGRNRYPGLKIVYEKGREQGKQEAEDEIRNKFEEAVHTYSRKQIYPKIEPWDEYLRRNLFPTTSEEAK